MKQLIQTAATIASLVVLTGWSVSSFATPDERHNWSFRVFLNDKEIGYHNFSLSHDGDKQWLETEAKFDVKVLFLTAFRYRHESTEVWEEGCLKTVNAATNNNGERLTVRGQRNAGVLSVTGKSGLLRLDDCVQSFAYWNPTVLEAKRLLNTQTGDYEEVHVRFDGTDTVTVGDRTVEAERYLLHAKEGTITLWYTSDDKRWLALEAPVENGRTLRYEPISVPGAGERALVRRG